ANYWYELHPGTALPGGRYEHAAVWSPAADGIYVFGGFLASRGPVLLNAMANMWEELNLSGALPDVRSQHTAVWSHEADGMYVFGGYDGQGSGTYFNDLWFHGCEDSRGRAVKASTWEMRSPGGNAPHQRYAHAAVWSPAGDGMYVFGGRDGRYLGESDFEWHITNWAVVSCRGVEPVGKRTLHFRWTRRRPGP
ncbi:tea1, partial [Symbiodinium pilosum]